MTEVRVPATTANVGSGFDCFGIALSLYNSIRVSETENGLFIKNHNASEYISRDENNLIYRSVIRAFDEVGYKKRGLKISQKSEIPMTRGLGSSSACIIGGLMAGNIISGRKLDTQRIFELANEIEGHPDNVAPALFGGFCISCADNSGLYRQTIRIPHGIKFAAMIPHYYVATKKSRKLLPDKVSLKDASFNIAHAASFVYAMSTGDFENLGIYTQDRLHQKYREETVPDMKFVFEKSMENGAKAVFLSGSGPSVIAVLNEKDAAFKDKMLKCFKENDIRRNCIELYADNVGVVSRSL